MIDHEKNLDSMDKQADEPPPYSQRQPSTSSGRNRLRSPSSPTGGRFVAPPPPNHPPPQTSPRIALTLAGHAFPDPRAASFTDLATEKPESPKEGMGYSGMGYSGMPDPMGSGYSMPSTSGTSAAGPSHMGIPPRSPTVGSKKGTETVILMGTGRSGQWLNHIVVSTKGESIQGQYHIDPNLEVQDHATPRRAGALGKKAHSRSTSSISSGKKKADLSWHPTAEPEPCNAFFESKTSTVDIMLSIGGQGSNKSSKANVDIKSKTGKVAVKVVDIGEGRRLNLDVSTSKGDIEIFVARSFSGPLHVHTEGEITLLPKLAATMEVISARENDALVMITSNRRTSSPSPSTSRSSHTNADKPLPGGFSAWLHPNSAGMRINAYEGDFANIVSSSGGNIVVGFLGEDKIKEESPGMWKKFVGLFTGERSKSA